MKYLFSRVLYFCRICSTANWQQNQNFEMAKSFLILFSTCTVHIVQDSQQLSKDSHCNDLTLGLHLISLRTTRVFQSTAFNHFNQSTLQVDMNTELLSFLYRKMFASKFNNICSVDLYLTQLIMEFRPLINNLNLKLLHLHLKSQESHKFYFPDFVIFPIAGNSTFGSEVLLNVSTVGPTKIILLDISKQTLYYVCTACARTENNVAIVSQTLRGISTVCIKSTTFEFIEKQIKWQHMNY